MREFKDFLDSIKITNILIIGVSEGEEREKGTKKLFEEITDENFPNKGGRKYSFKSRKHRESHTG